MGTALILLAPIPVHIFGATVEPGSIGVLEYVLTALSSGAVALGTLLLLLGAACLLFIKRSAPETVRSKPIHREETVLRVALMITVAAVLLGFALLALAFLMLISGVPETSLDALGTIAAVILMVVVPILYSLLLVAWATLKLRRLSIAKATPPDEPGSSEDGEK